MHNVEWKIMLQCVIVHPVLQEILMIIIVVVSEFLKFVRLIMTAWEVWFVKIDVVGLHVVLIMIVQFENSAEVVIVF